MGTGTGDPQPGDGSAVTADPDARPEREDLVEREFAVLEVAAGKMVIVLEVGGRDQFTGDDRPGPVFIDLRQLIEDARLEGLALLIGLVEADHRNGEDLQLENTAAFRSESGIVSARHPQP